MKLIKLCAEFKGVVYKLHFFIKIGEKGLINKYNRLWIIFVSKTKEEKTLVNFKNYLIKSGEDIITLNEGNKLLKNINDDSQLQIDFTN